jgi:nucleoid DNA-binding protein
MATKTKSTKKTPVQVADSDTSDNVAEVNVADEAIGQENIPDPNLIKKKDIYDHVSVSTGLRKRDVREAVDSMLEYLHSNLSNGKTIQVPPLGKIKSVERGTGDNIKMHYKLMLKKTDDIEKKVD